MNGRQIKYSILNIAYFLVQLFFLNISFSNLSSFTNFCDLLTLRMTILLRSDVIIYSLLSPKNQWLFANAPHTRLKWDGKLRVIVSICVPNFASQDIAVSFFFATGILRWNECLLQIAAPNAFVRPYRPLYSILYLTLLYLK